MHSTCEMYLGAPALHVNCAPAPHVLLRLAQAENVAKKAALKKRKAVSDAAPGAKAGDAQTGAGAGGQLAAKRRKKKEWWEEELDGQRERRALDVDDDAAYYRAEVGPHCASWRLVLASLCPCP